MTRRREPKARSLIQPETKVSNCATRTGSPQREEVPWAPAGWRDFRRTQKTSQDWVERRKVPAGRANPLIEVGDAPAQPRRAGRGNETKASARVPGVGVSEKERVPHVLPAQPRPLRAAHARPCPAPRVPARGMEGKGRGRRRESRGE